MPMAFATEVVSTTPAPLLSSGASFCTVKKAPLTLIANSSSYTSSVIVSKGVVPAMPALTNRASIVPSSPFTRSARASRSDSEATSPRTATAFSPRSLAASTVARERPVITTRAPPSTSSFANANPMPAPPPVITAFLSLYIPIFLSTPRELAAVDAENLPGEPARPVGHEEQHRVGDVVGLTVAPHGRGADRARPQVEARPVLPRRPAAGGGGPAGAHGVDPDPERGQLGGQPAAVVLQRHLRRLVVQERRCPGDDPGRGYLDDRPPTPLPHPP